MIYTPAKWFWVLPDGRVWSSEKRSFVQPSDTSLVWHNENVGFIPPASCEQDIRDALSVAGLPHLAPGYVPPVVPLWKARAALQAAGLFATVDAAIQASGGAVLQAWEYGTEVSRGSDLVWQMGELLQLTDAQIDALFIAADTITV